VNNRKSPDSFCFTPATLKGRIFFFVFALLLCDPFSVISAAESDKTPSSVLVAAGAAGPSSADARQGLSANFPELTTSLIINISVNKEGKGDLFVERGGDGELFIKVEDLVALKLKFPLERAVLITGEQYAPLSAVQDIYYTVDEKNLTVSILGKTTESKKTEIELYPLGVRPRNLYYPFETSAFFNYGLAYSYTDPFGARSFSFPNKIGARAGNVFFVSDSLYTETDTSRQFVRLSSAATYEQRNDLQWLVLGDQFANSGELGSSVNIGGIGFSKLYRLDPYFITQPLFNIQGMSQFPTEADVYLDGVMVSRQQVAPGQFELKNIYSYTGSHKVDVVLKDPFGNEQKISYPFYFSTQMLREGLHEYSYNAGFIREQYGLKSDEYGKAAFSVFHRYGITSALNIGARAEGTDGLYNGGLFTSFSFPRIGAFLVSSSGSNARAGKGFAGSIQHSYQVGSFSTAALYREFSRGYATIGSLSAASQEKNAVSLSAGFTMGALGSFGLGYSTNETWDSATTRVTSANYSRALSRTVSLFAMASRTRAADAVNAFFIGLNFSPSSAAHGSVQLSRTGETNTETVQFQKDTPVGEGLGYRASLNRSEAGATSSYGFNPGLQYNARYGIYTLDSAIQSVEHGQTTKAYNVSASGAIVYAGGFFGLARPINDSFSIVMVDNMPNAAVLNNGQVIGETDFSGRMVVPALASYGQNQITVDVKNMPLDYNISGVNRALSPSAWSGSCVSFDTVKVRALTGTLYFRSADKKTPLEYIDISVKVGTREISFPTGKGGEFYMENSLPDENKTESLDKQSCRAIAERKKTGGNTISPGTYRAWVDIEGGRCVFFITFPETEDSITDIGEVQCDVMQKAELMQ
jgi:outer membrane usher protein FimD/PapC